MRGGERERQVYDRGSCVGFDYLREGGELFDDGIGF